MSPEEFHARLEAYASVSRGAAIRGIWAGALRGISILKQTARDQGAFNTGRYLRGWKATFPPWGATLYNTVPYAANIERGRGAGAKFPPKRPIVNWLMRKQGLSRPDAKRAYFPVARAIARRGIKAKPVLNIAVTQIRRAVLEAIEQQVEKARRSSRL